MLEQSVNTFEEGLVTDLNPLTTPNNCLTNCLNGTIITMNGNEFILQNDMGNGRVDLAYLPNGYVPVGMKEYGGIIYVAAYNPITNMCQVGSFPSPERNFSSSDSSNDTSGDLEYPIRWSDFFTNSDSLLKSLEYKFNILPNFKINPGDKFGFSVSKIDDEFTNIPKEWKNFISYYDGNGESLITLQIGVYSNSGAFIPLEQDFKRFDDESNLIDKTKFPEKGYWALRNNSSTNSGTEDVSNKRKQAKNMNIYTKKYSGDLTCIARLTCIETFSATVDWKFIDTEKGKELHIIFDAVPGDKGLKFLEGAKLKWSINNANEIEESVKYKYNETYDEAKYSNQKYILLSENVYYPIAETENNQTIYYRELDKTLKFDIARDKCEGILNWEITPKMIYGEIPSLTVKGSLDLSKIRETSFSIKKWQYYIDTENKRAIINLGLEIYKSPNIHIDSIELTFHELNAGRQESDFKLYIESSSYIGTFQQEISLDSSLELSKIYIVEIKPIGTDLPVELNVTEYKTLYTTTVFNGYFGKDDRPDFTNETVNTILLESEYNKVSDNPNLIPATWTSNSTVDSENNIVWNNLTRNTTISETYEVNCEIVKTYLPFEGEFSYSSTISNTKAGILQSPKYVDVTDSKEFIIQSTGSLTDYNEFIKLFENNTLKPSINFQVLNNNNLIVPEITFTDIGQKKGIITPKEGSIEGLIYKSVLSKDLIHYYFPFKYEDGESYEDIDDILFRWTFIIEYDTNEGGEGEDANFALLNIPKTLEGNPILYRPWRIRQKGSKQAYLLGNNFKNLDYVATYNIASESFEKDNGLLSFLNGHIPYIIPVLCVSDVQHLNLEDTFNKKVIRSKNPSEYKNSQSTIRVVTKVDSDKIENNEDGPGDATGTFTSKIWYYNKNVRTNMNDGNEYMGDCLAFIITDGTYYIMLPNVARLYNYTADRKIDIRHFGRIKEVIKNTFKDIYVRTKETSDKKYKYEEIVPSGELVKYTVDTKFDINTEVEINSIKYEGELYNRDYLESKLEKIVNHNNPILYESLLSVIEKAKPSEDSINIKDISISNTVKIDSYEEFFDFHSANYVEYVDNQGYLNSVNWEKPIMYLKNKEAISGYDFKISSLQDLEALDATERFCAISEVKDYVAKPKISLFNSVKELTTGTILKMAEIGINKDSIETVCGTKGNGCAQYGIKIHNDNFILPDHGIARFNLFESTGDGNEFTILPYDENKKRYTLNDQNSEQVGGLARTYLKDVLYLENMYLSVSGDTYVEENRVKEEAI